MIVDGNVDEPGGRSLVDILGTEAGDTLTGTADGDVIRALGGADTVDAGGGADLVYGGDGDDTVGGDIGDDTLFGEAGNDYLNGGQGSDVLDGGDGDDQLYDSDNGSDTLRGGVGKDQITVLHSQAISSETIVVEAGADDDWVRFGTTSQSNTTIDLGAGSDQLELYQYGGGSLTVTLGAGRDRISLNPYYTGSGFTVADFASGATGDVFDLDLFLRLNLVNWNGSNPFGADGYLRLVQSGNDTLLQIDRDGTRAGSYGYVTLATLQNVQAGTLTADNFNGLSPDGKVGSGQSIMGPELGETLTGTANDDVIRALGGADTVNAGGGADLVYGGSGDDTVQGELGDDMLYGDAGNDYLVGSEGSDTLDGGDGDDKLYDSANGSDTMRGGAGKDEIRISHAQGQRSETIVVDAGADDDKVYYDSTTSGSTSMDLGAGDDQLALTQNYFGALRLTLGTGQDRVTLGSYYNNSGSWYNSVTVTDFAVGAAGDVFELNAFLTQNLINWDGANPFGPKGFLRLLQSGSDTLLQLDRDGTGGSNASYFTLTTFQNTLASAFTADNFNGLDPNGTQLATASVIAPVSVIEGVDGGAALSILLKNVSTASGSITISFDAAGSTAANGTDVSVPTTTTTYDVSQSTAGDYTIDLPSIGIFDDLVAEGTETLSIKVTATGLLFDNGTDTTFVTISLLDSEVDGTSGNDVLTGRASADMLRGFGGDDVLDGGAGNDVLDGGTGSDRMSGGVGDDIYHVDDAGDRVVERVGEGHDRVYSTIDYRLTANVEDLVLDGSGDINGTGNVLDNAIAGNDGDNVLNGGAGDDDLTGGLGDDRLTGGAGADRMDGGAGDDTYSVDNAADVVIEGSDGGFDTILATVDFVLGDDAEKLVLSKGARIGTGNAGHNVIIGSNGADTLSGLAGGDQLAGGAGGDRLDGGTGDDTLTGGIGRDLLTGGEGADLFVFADGDSSADRASADRILDFSRDEGDRVSLRQIDAISTTSEDDRFTFIGKTEFSGIAGELRYQRVGGETSIMGDMDGDGIADLVVRFDEAIVFVKSDFLL
jgi:Ca2+-binding RTX toxin-like protein